MRRKGIKNTSIARAVLKKLGYEYIPNGKYLTVETEDWKTLRQIIKDQSE